MDTATLNAKRCKAIRKMLNADLKKYGLTVSARIVEKRTVPSRRYSVSVAERSGFVFSHDAPWGAWTIFEKEKQLKNTAIQARLQAGCPRQIYQEIKRRVSTAWIA